MPATIVRCGRAVFPGMPNALLAASVLCLSGCAHWFGPAEGVLRVTGSTPDGQPCLLTAEAVDAPRPALQFTVSGTFNESVIVPPARRGHRLSLHCGGVRVAERDFRYGRDVHAGGTLRLETAAR